MFIQSDGESTIYRWQYGERRPMQESTRYEIDAANKTDVVLLYDIIIS